MRRIALTLAFGLAMIAGGCGSSSPSGVSPAAYVKSVCDSLQTWSAGVKAASDQLQSVSTGTTSLAQGKQLYGAFVGSLVTDTKLAAAQLRAAGVPAVSGGKQISATLVSAFEQAGTGLSNAASQAANIPTSNAAAFQAGEAGVTAVIKASLTGVTRVSPRKNPQLHAAAAKQPACQALKSVG